MTRSNEWSDTLTRDRVELHRRMWVLRLVDMAVEELHIRGMAERSGRGTFGSEAVGIGATAALRQGDICSTAYRPQGQSAGLDSPLGPAIVGLLGDSRGNDDTLDQAPLLAIGQAYSQWLSAEGTATLCITEENQANSAHLADAAKMAALWRLPVVLVVERRGEPSPAQGAVAPQDAGAGEAAESALHRLAASAGMPIVSIDGHNVDAVWICVAAAMERARAGEGPTLVEAVTSGTADPLVLSRQRLDAAGIDSDRLAEIEESARGLVSEAVAFAKAVPRADDDGLRPSATWWD